MRLIFIAVPTAGAIADGRPREEFVRAVARLHERHPDCAFIVPMIEDYAVVPYLETSPTWEVWGERASAKLAACAEVWVIEYDGWDTSVGVTAERSLATRLHKLVRHLAPDTLAERFSFRVE